MQGYYFVIYISENKIPGDIALENLIKNTKLDL